MTARDDVDKDPEERYLRQSAFDSERYRAEVRRDQAIERDQDALRRWEAFAVALGVCSPEEAAEYVQRVQAERDALQARLDAARHALERAP